MKIIFSYVLFGNDCKYFEPLMRNISAVYDEFGELALIYIVGINIPRVWINEFNLCDNVVFNDASELVHQPASLKMMARYRVINEFPYSKTCFVFRDADSFISSGEFKIIKHWVHSEYVFSVVRDHTEHVMPIMGGLFCCKDDGTRFLRKALQSLKSATDDFNDYGYDQVFLDQYVYRFQKHNILVYSSCGVFVGEKVVDISNLKVTIGGYSESIRAKKRKFTMLPASIFRLLNYRGSKLRIHSWFGVDIVDKILF